MVISSIFVSVLCSLLTHALTERYVGFILNARPPKQSEALFRRMQVKAIANAQLSEHLFLAALVTLLGVFAKTHKLEKLALCLAVSAFLHLRQILDALRCRAKPNQIPMDFRGSTLIDDDFRDTLI